MRLKCHLGLVMQDPGLYNILLPNANTIKLTYPPDEADCCQMEVASGTKRDTHTHMEQIPLEAEVHGPMKRHQFTAKSFSSSTVPVPLLGSNQRYSDHKHTWPPFLTTHQPVVLQKRILLDSTIGDISGQLLSELKACSYLYCYMDLDLKHKPPHGHTDICNRFIYLLMTFGPSCLFWPELGQFQLNHKNSVHQGFQNHDPFRHGSRSDW